MAKYDAMLAVLEKPNPKTYADLPEHVRKWLEGKNTRDLAEIDEAQQLIDRLPVETRNWLKGKNAKDLQNIDAAVEFIGSSRTAARVLMWIGGIAVTFLTGSWALAKAGIDAFAMFRGGIR